MHIIGTTYSIILPHLPQNVLEVHSCPPNGFLTKLSLDVCTLVCRRCQGTDACDLVCRTPAISYICRERIGFK